VPTTAPVAAEDSHWRENYKSRPYVLNDATYDDYGPAYAFGEHARRRQPDAGFNDVESDLAGGWGSARGNSRLEWEHAKHAVRDAWDRTANTSRDPNR
jgi:hypothetical protein